VFRAKKKYLFYIIRELSAALTEKCKFLSVWPHTDHSQTEVTISNKKEIYDDKGGGKTAQKAVFS